ncbi:MAG: DMT family transporter [Prolixibacteraceae bacterium]|nr:DMT family transporter [Prolixibacteraceae bacterium]
MAWEKRWFQYTILMVCATIWGSSFILMKIGLKSFDSNQAAAIRIFLAALVLLPYSIKNLKYLTRKDLPSLLVAGFIGSFFPAFLFTKAQTRIDSSMAGMLNSLTPVFTLLVGMVFLKIKFKWFQIVGLILGLGGALGLILSGNEIDKGSFNAYALLIVLATLFYAINVNQIKTRLSHLRGIQITSLSFLFIGPVALIYLLNTDLSMATQNQDWLWHFTALAILGIVGTALAMILMNSLIRYSSAIYASSVTYIIPVFAIFWGLLDGEKITLLHLFCMAIILLGVYLINRKTA